MRIVAFAVAAALFTACAEDVGEGRVTADVTEATPAPAPAPASSSATTLAVDASRSNLGLIGAKVTAQHPIKFNEFTGEVVLDGETVTGVNFVAQVSSIEADVGRLTDHLKHADLLDAERFPTGEFASTSITPSADGEWTHSVTGNLLIHGVTKQVTFPAKIVVTATEVSASTEFVINRHDFEVSYPGRPDDLIQDNVAMKIDFVAPFLMPRAVLFDLDGTLVDSAPDLTAALNVVLAARDRPPLAEDVVRTLIGGGARRLLDRAVALTGEPLDEDLFPPFRHAYRARIAVKSRVYPGITAVLAGVRKRGDAIAVCTNKPEDMARELVSRLGLDLLVQDLVGSGHVPRKPDPAPVHLLMARLGVQEAVLVGDSEADVGAARAAGIPSIGVTWGYGDVTGADHIVDGPVALDEVLSRA